MIFVSLLTDLGWASESCSVEAGFLLSLALGVAKRLERRRGGDG